MSNAGTQSARRIIGFEAVVIPQGEGCYLTKPGKPIFAETRVTTARAAIILSLSQRYIEQMCDEGRFKSAIKPSGRPAGKWLIDLEEVLTLSRG